MSTTVASLDRDHVRIHWRFEVVAIAGLTGAAWLALIWSGHLHHSEVSHVTMPDMPGMAHSGSTMARSVSAVIAGWPLMCVAMMGIGTIPMVRWVRRNALRRRWHAVPTVVVAYLAVWTATGSVAAVVLRSIGDGHRAAASALMMGAAWQLTPMKRWAMTSCDRPSPLRLSGFKATRSEIAFGVRQGATCVASCWLFMLPMALAVHPSSLAMAGGTVVVTTERLHRRPRFARRLGAIVLVVTSLLVALL